jgi:cell division septal protein FtsQ
MPAPAPRRAAAPRVVRQPSRVERAVLRERARRRARVEHKLERKRARRRFLVLLVFLLFVTVFLGLTIWDQIQALFGL